MTTESAEIKNGISKAINWCRALSPPMNGYLLLLAQEKSRAISGKKPRIANTARRPTSMSATTNPGPAGIRATTAAAVATYAIGAAQKISLSAPGNNNFFRYKFQTICNELQDTLDLAGIEWAHPELHLGKKFALYEYCCCRNKRSVGKSWKHCDLKERTSKQCLNDWECTLRI